MSFSNSFLSKLVENSIYLYPGMNAERCAQVNFRRAFKATQNYTVTHSLKTDKSTKATKKDKWLLCRTWYITH